MRFALVFPHAFRPTADALDAIPALARIASYGRREVVDDADAAVARLANMADAATAPLAALGAGLDVRDAYVLRADPVTFVAGRDDVLVAGRVDDMTLADAGVLIELLNRHFADDGVVFHAPRADAWFATARERVPVETDPLQANAPVGPHLPRGAYAATWRRWLSEMQMLLHEHPVNERREAAGLAPATGIWLSGGGTLADAVPAPPPVAIHAAPSRAGDVAAGIARLAGSTALTPPARFDALARDSDSLVVLKEFGEHVTRDWLSPAVSALERGAIDRLTVVAVDDRAHRYEATRPSWWRRLRART
jgi:hypothetical protein